jgi:DNA modification methylase
LYPFVSGKERLKHPTQKPEKIIELFIKYWSNEGDIILDPFVGTGTTMKVAQDLKRSCIGIEINKEYFEMAKRRIKLI